MGGDKFAEATGNVKRGWVITVEIKAIEDSGIEVEYEGMKSFIRKSDHHETRACETRKVYVGDKVDVRVTNIDNKTRKLGVSIKAREIAEEKEAVEQYGSSDSGASLGDILGAALKQMIAIKKNLEIASQVRGGSQFRLFLKQYPKYLVQKNLKIEQFYQYLQNYKKHSKIIDLNNKCLFSMALVFIVFVCAII